MKFNRNIFKLAGLSLILPFLASCESGGPLFDEEGDCSVKVQFVFKKHRQAIHQISGKETDAFYATVPSVHLFVYDKESGALVFEKIEKTENLKSASELGIGSGTDKNYMQVDLDPGKYKFVAWCGLDDDDQNNAFTLTDGTRAGYSHCKVKLHDATGQPVNQAKYEGLYHGKVETAEVTEKNMGKQVIEVPLTKNTNDITVWVQHTTASFAEGDYTVVYSDANGHMKFEDNDMGSDDTLEYFPHSTTLLTSDSEYNGAEVEAGALIAHLSTSRLMDSHSESAKLEIRDKEGNTVYSIPFIKYLTNMQTATNDNQYYLDCEDTYNCTFYLTGSKEEDGQWLPLQIIINNWAIVPTQSGGMGGDDE